MMRSKLILATTMVLLALTTVQAQENRPTLTSRNLDRYLAILPGLDKIVQKEVPNFDGRNLDALKNSPMESEVKRFLNKKGWTVMEFSWISTVVGRGLSYLMANESMDELQKEMLAQKEEMMSDPNIPESVKQQMLAMMNKQPGGAGGYLGSLSQVPEELTPAELKLLEANKDRILKVYEGLGK